MSEKIQAIQIPGMGMVDIRPLDTTRRGCIDRRPLIAAQSPTIYPSEAPTNPGSTLGMMIDFMTAAPHVPVRDVATTTSRSEREVEGRQIDGIPIVTMHGDDEGGICGHLGNTSDPKNAARYPNLPSTKVEDLVGEVGRLAEKGDIVLERPTLGGPHREKVVVQVFSHSHTIAPRENPHAYFRVDVGHYNDSLDRLAEFAGTEGINVGEVALHKAAQENLLGSAGILAAGHDIYNVYLHNPSETRVEFAGSIPRGA